MPQLMRHIVFLAPPGSKAEHPLIESEGRKTETAAAERPGKPRCSVKISFLKRQKIIKASVIEAE